MQFANRLSSVVERLTARAELAWVLRAMYKWRAAVADLKLHKKMVSSFARSVGVALDRWKYRVLSQAMGRLGDEVEAQRRLGERGKVAMRCMRRWVNSLLADAIARWRTHGRTTRDRHRRAAVTRRCAVRVGRDAQATALSIWAKKTRSMALCERTLRKMVWRYAGGHKTEAFAAWRVWLRHTVDADTTRTRHASVVQHCLGRMRRLGAARSFGSWLEFTERRALCRRVMRKSGRRRRGSLLAEGFVSWRALAVDVRNRDNDEARREATAKEMRHKVKMSLVKWQRRELCSCFESWLTMVDSRLLCRRVMNKIIQRYLLGAQSRAFISWRAFADNGRIAETETARLDVIVRKVAKRMVRLTVARTFDRWSENVAEAKEQRHKVATVLRRWQRRALGAVVNQWCTMVDQRVLCRRVMNKILQRYLLGAQSRALISWRAFADDDRIAEVEEARLEVIVRKVAKRMIQLTTARTFDRWAENVTEKRDQRHKIGSILRRWQRLELSAMLEKWVGMTDDRILCRRVMHKIMRRYELGSQSKGFVSWRSFLDADRDAEADTARKEAILIRCATRMKNLAKARTLSRWVQVVSTAKEMRHKVKMSLVKWQRRELCSCFESWLTMVDSRVLCRRVMNKIIRRYELGSQTKGFVSWRMISLQETRNSAILEKCTRRMRQLTHARTFSRWADAVREAKTLRHKVKTSLVRWQRRELTAVIGAWNEKVDCRVLCRRVMHKILMRYELGGQAKGFASWRAHSMQAGRHATILDRCTRRMTMQLHVRTFNRWAEAVREAQALRRRVQCAVTRWQKQELVGVLGAWIEFVENRTLCRRVLRKVLHRYERFHETKGFSSWRTFVVASRIEDTGAARREADRALARRLLRWIILRKKSKAMALAFRMWSCRCLAEVRGEMIRRRMAEAELGEALRAARSADEQHMREAATRIEDFQQDFLARLQERDARWEADKAQALADAHAVHVHGGEQAIDAFKTKCLLRLRQGTEQWNGEKVKLLKKWSLERSKLKSKLIEDNVLRTACRERVEFNQRQANAVKEAKEETTKSWKIAQYWRRQFEGTLGSSQVVFGTSVGEEPIKAMSDPSAYMTLLDDVALEAGSQIRRRSPPAARGRSTSPRRATGTTDGSSPLPVEAWQEQMPTFVGPVTSDTTTPHESSKTGILKRGRSPGKQRRRSRSASKKRTASSERKHHNTVRVFTS